MKKLYLIGGTMGVGKTTVCRALKKQLKNSVFLDGDWCWDSDPFIVTEETKVMVLDNICHLLNNFIGCSAYENIILGWVMHEQGIIDGILSHLDTSGCEVKRISLVCRMDVLEARLAHDIERGLREPGIVGRSAARVPFYDSLDTVKIDVSDITPEEAAAKIALL